MKYQLIITNFNNNNLIFQSEDESIFNEFKEPINKTIINFKPKEFRSKDNDPTIIINYNLLLGLEQLRTIINLPIKINSGYRSKQHNQKIKGKPNSQHLKGNAADITIPNMTPNQIKQIAETIEVFNNGGIGTYSKQNFIHLDVRNKKTRWNN